MKNEKLTLEDTGMEAMMKLAQGNPGAITALMEIVSKHKYIDPQSALGFFGVLFDFDEKEIYGPDIWILYKDCCGQKVDNLIACMRAVQLGIKPNSWLKESIAANRRIDCDEVMAAVKAQLKDFNVQAKVA